MPDLSDADVTTVLDYLGKDQPLGRKAISGTTGAGGGGPVTGGPVTGASSGRADGEGVVSSAIGGPGGVGGSSVSRSSAGSPSSRFARSVVGAPSGAPSGSDLPEILAGFKLADALRQAFDFPTTGGGVNPDPNAPEAQQGNPFLFPERFPGAPGFLQDPLVPPGDWDPHLTPPDRGPVPLGEPTGTEASVDSGGSRLNIRGDLIASVAPAVTRLLTDDPTANRAVGTAAGAFKVGSQIGGADPSLLGAGIGTGISLGQDLASSAPDDVKTNAAIHDVVRGIADFAGMGIPSLLDNVIQLFGGPSGASVWQELFGPSGSEFHDPLQDIRRQLAAAPDQADYWASLGPDIQTALIRTGWEGSGPPSFANEAEQALFMASRPDLFQTTPVEFATNESAG